MTLLTATFQSPQLLDQISISEPVRAKAWRAMRHLSEIISQAFPMDAEEFAYRFDKEIASINDSIIAATKFSEEQAQKTEETIRELNWYINRTTVGDPKFDATGQGCEMINLCREILFQIADVANEVKRRIELSNINRVSLSNSIEALDGFAKALLRLCCLFEKVVERTEIHDAMTEQPLKKTGIAELDALNEL